MALYDNKHWLLSHIRDSFISTDDTSICELVMVREDIPKHLRLSGAKCYPGIDDDSDEDSQSYDIQMDRDFGHRHRSNTAQRLEKMDQARKRFQKINHIKLEGVPVIMSDKDISELFEKKDLNKNIKPIIRQSLLSEQLEKSPQLPKNPFKEYAKFNGHEQYDEPVRKYRIFMCMLNDKERSYPRQITVVSSATVKEFIGLICYKYASENPTHNLKEDITKYGLFITEDDDGEVDMDFPCLDSTEPISKFDFSSLCLVELRPCDLIRHEPIGKVFDKKIVDNTELNKVEQQRIAEDLARMKRHTTAMEAPLYQLYKVYIVNRVTANTEIHLGISGDKIEIDPVLPSKSAIRLLNRQRAESHSMDNIAWCDINDRKGNKTTFTLIYSPNSSFSDSSNVIFKKHEFEAETTIADSVVKKINNILELRTSNARKEYLAYRERKSMRKKK